MLKFLHRQGVTHKHNLAWSSKEKLESGGGDTPKLTKLILQNMKKGERQEVTAEIKLSR